MWKEWALPQWGPRRRWMQTSRPFIGSGEMWSVWVFVQRSDEDGGLVKPKVSCWLGRVVGWNVIMLGWKFSQVTITECHRLGGLNDRHSSPHRSGSWKSKIKVPTGWFLMRTPFLAWRWSLSYCTLWWLHLCAQEKANPVSLSLLVRTPTLYG